MSDCVARATVQQHGTHFVIECIVYFVVIIVLFSVGGGDDANAYVCVFSCLTRYTTIIESSCMYQSYHTFSYQPFVGYV